jgi:hypothetical protein
MVQWRFMHQFFYFSHACVGQLSALTTRFITVRSAASAPATKTTDTPNAAGQQVAQTFLRCESVHPIIERKRVCP